MIGTIDNLFKTVVMGISLLMYWIALYIETTSNRDENEQNFSHDQQNHVIS